MRSCMIKQPAAGPGAKQAFGRGRAAAAAATAVLEAA